MVDGYGFHWFPYQKPFTDHPTMGRIEHEVEHYVPYITVEVGGVTPFVSNGPLIPAGCHGGAQ